MIPYERPRIPQRKLYKWKPPKNIRPETAKVRYKKPAIPKSNPKPKFR